MPRIKAAVCREIGGPLSVETVDLRAPGPGEVELTLSASAICHSDISYADGVWGGDAPFVLGHEAAGTITAKGPGVDLDVGQTAIATLIQSCGACPSCARSRPASCLNKDTSITTLQDAEGTWLPQPLTIAAFAERVVVDQSQVATIPETIPATSASLLACGVITGVGAATNAAGITRGENVIVIGAGGVGLNAIQGARIAGAARIVAIDMTEEKLSTAKDFGATDGVLGTSANVWDDIRARLGRGADAVLVTVGVASLCTDAAQVLDPGGRIVIVGMPPSGAMSAYEPVLLAHYGQSIIGSKMGETVLARDIPVLVDRYQDGTLLLDELVSRTWSLDQINEAIADTRAGAARRNVIVF